MGGRDPSAGTGEWSQSFNHDCASKPAGLPDCSTINWTCATSIAIVEAKLPPSLMGPCAAAPSDFDFMLP